MPAILGDEEFIGLIRSRFYRHQSSRHVPQSRILAVPIGVIKQAVARVYETEPEKLTVARRGYFNEARDAAIYLARKHSGKMLLAIGAEFNMGQYSSVSSVVNKMKQLCKENKRIRARVQEIEEALIKGQT